jgi:hypothetical protein
VSAVISGHGAGAACSGLLDGCSAERARHLLGVSYRDEMGWRELESLHVGYTSPRAHTAHALSHCIQCALSLSLSLSLSRSLSLSLFSLVSLSSLSLLSLSSRSLSLLSLSLLSLSLFSSLSLSLSLSLLSLSLFSLSLVADERCAVNTTAGTRTRGPSTRTSTARPTSSTALAARHSERRPTAGCSGRASGPMRGRRRVERRRTRCEKSTAVLPGGVARA